MSYDESLADRIRALLKRRKGISEKKMFGGVSFLLNGNMACGIIGDKLVLRLGDEGAAEALGEPNVSAMDFTGRPMKSMVYIHPKAFATDDDLASWVERAIAYAKSLPAKK